MDSDNIYADLVMERFSLPVPLLRQDKNQREAFAPCVVLSESYKRKARKQAYMETVQDFNGKVPKTDEAGIEVWNSTFQDNLGAWIIFYAIRVPGNLDKQLFLSKDQLVNDYSPEEIGIMYSNYMTVVLNQRNMLHFNEDDPHALSQVMDTIIKQNTVEETAFFFNSYTTHSLATLVRSLVAQHYNSPTPSGSSGSPSSDTTLNDKTPNDETNG